MAAFLAEHNITNPNVIKLITEGSHTPKADPGRPHRLVYDGVLSTTPGPLDGPPKVLARIRIIAQYHWQTEKADYVLKNKHDKIGVITAYCRNVPKNRCPDKVNK
ncbi:hypothetical protein OG520_21025 [Streptomyces sp. NBC_00984]|uniref:hypothetical protein n=1 Tax=Streptomyces sp. NBC_00984 TaxID=2903700 RepID=UPI003869AAE2|nr:hypothetical protein OG520_21025 [Streptomyces sp. NBC_00984]